MSTFRQYVLAGSIVAVSIISIGISSWQYENGNKSDVNLGQSIDDFCKDWPYKYVRRK
jgi:hypothetical protein